MYLPRKTNVGEPVVREIIVDLYLVEDLKANILLSIDVVGLEEIDVITSRKYLYIDSCGIRILIKIRPRGIEVHRLIKVK